MHTVLKTISYRDEAAKEMVTKFCGHVHRLIRLRHVFKVLFEDERPSCQTLMKKTAWSFFLDLNTVLQEYLLLECAKITDPATTDSHANFTVDALVQNICWPNDEAILKKMTSLPDDDKDIMKALKFWQDITQDFRGCIKRARNKLLAHLDRKAILSGKPLGEFPEGKDRRFFEALQKICNITHEACFRRIYGDMLPVGAGDVISLRKTLKCAVAFEQALLESSGQTKTWLYSCMQKAGDESKS